MFDKARDDGLLEIFGNVEVPRAVPRAAQLLHVVAQQSTTGNATARETATPRNAAVSIKTKTLPSAVPAPPSKPMLRPDVSSSFTGDPIDVLLDQVSLEIDDDHDTDPSGYQEETGYGSKASQHLNKGPAKSTTANVWPLSLLGWTCQICFWENLEAAEVCGALTCGELRHSKPPAPTATPPVIKPPQTPVACQRSERTSSQPESALLPSGKVHQSQIKKTAAASASRPRLSTFSPSPVEPAPTKFVVAVVDARSRNSRADAKGFFFPAPSAVWLYRRFEEREAQRYAERRAPSSIAMCIFSCN